MVTPTLESHHIILHDGTVGNSVGFICKPRNGVLFSRYPAPPIMPVVPQSLGREAFNSQQEQPFSVTTNHAGFGKEVYTTNRYNSAYGTDASGKNVIKLSPVKTALTNSNPTQTGYNGGFENWTTIEAKVYPDNWAYVYQAAEDPACFKDTSQFQAGAASLRGPASVAGAVVTLRQTLPVTAVTDTIMTATIYGRAITSDATITWKLTDATETQLATQADTVTAGAGWVVKTFAYTFTGTKATPILEIKLTEGAFDSGWLDAFSVAWTGTAVTTLTPGTTVGAIDFNSAHYVYSDTGLWKRTAGDLAWVGGSPPGITNAFISADGKYLVLCRGDSLNYWLMRTNESFVINSGATQRAKTKGGFTSAGLNYMFFDTPVSGGTINAYKVNSFEAATATTDYTIGTSQENFTKGIDHIADPFFIKENSAYYINSSGTVIEVASELRSLDNTNTGKNSISWKGNGAQALYMPAGTDATLMAYDDGLVDNVGPIEFLENLTDFDGQIVATASDDKWLYVCIDNGTKIEILKGRYETIDGVTDFRWHPVIEDTYTTVAWMHVSSITAKRLYYGGGTALPKYISLADDSYATGGTHITSWIDLGLPNISKNFRSVALRSRGLTANLTVKVEYNLDGETSWTELGGSGNGTFTTSPFQEKFLGTSGAGVNSRRIQFRLTLATNSTASTPEVIDFTVNYILNPPLLDIIEFDTIIGGQLTLLGDTDEDMSYGYVMTKLRSWRTTVPLTLIVPDGLFTGTDGVHDGESLLVHFAPGGFIDDVIKVASNEPVDQQAIVTLKFYQLRTS